MKKTLTIVLTGGGSGGHITPLLSLAHALKEVDSDCKVVYFGLKGESLEDSLKKRYQIFDAVYSVPSGKLRRYHNQSFLAHIVDIRTLLLNIRDFFIVLAGIVVAHRLIGEIKPDVVFSKGGFVAVPVGLAAKMHKIPIVTHDSDSVAGLANKIVGRYAKVRTSGMPTKLDTSPIKFVGIPVDERIKPISPTAQKKFKEDIGFPPSSPVLLVGGAGLGSRDVNNATIAIAPELLKKYKNLQLVHLTGNMHEREVKAKYDNLSQSLKSRIRVIGFTPDFYKYTGAADIIVTRAGATTIAELAIQKKPVILIPAPQLSGGHQLKNAQELKNFDAAEVVQNDSEPKMLLKSITNLFDHPELREKLSQNIGSIAQADASETLAKILIAEATSKQVQS